MQSDLLLESSDDRPVRPLFIIIVEEYSKHCMRTNFFCRRYFQKKDSETDGNIASEEDKPTVSNWWHRKLADYFETADNVDRLVEVSAVELRLSTSCLKIYSTPCGEHNGSVVECLTQDREIVGSTEPHWRHCVVF